MAFCATPVPHTPGPFGLLCMQLYRDSSWNPVVHHVPALKPVFVIMMFTLSKTLFELQDTAAAAADSAETASTALQLVWALHAIVDGHTANQQALQAAGGLPLITSLLAQASTQPSAETLPLPPSHATPDTPAADPTQPVQAAEHAQSERGGGHTTVDNQAANQAQLVHALVWLLGSAAAGVPANQLALHQLGAVYLLLHHMQWSKSPAVVTGAMWALASLAKGSADVQSEVQLQVWFQLLISSSWHGMMPVLVCLPSHKASVIPNPRSLPCDKACCVACSDMSHGLY